MRIISKIFIIFLLFFILFSLIAADFDENFFNLYTIRNTQPKFFFDPQNTTIAVISEPQGFSQMNVGGEILKGLLAIKKEFPISLILLTLESYDNVSINEQFNKAIEGKANIIIAYGEKIRDKFVEFAINNPNIFFIGVDMFTTDIELKNFIEQKMPQNLSFISYKEEEAGFLAGVFASLVTKDYNYISNRLNPENILGIIIAKYNDSKYRYELGFRLGALALNDKCSIIDIKLDDETDFYLIRKSTVNLYKNGADIIFQLCGAGSGAAIQAAYLSGNFIIGYEFDQNIYAPENVVTSAIKRISSSIYYFFKNCFLTGFSAGIFRLGIKDGAVGLASFHQFDLIIPEQIKSTLYKVSISIAQGKINIPFVSLTIKEDEQNFQTQTISNNSVQPSSEEDQSEKNTNIESNNNSND